MVALLFGLVVLSIGAAATAKAPGPRQLALLQREVLEDSSTAEAGGASSTAVFAAGCFWSVELAFARVPGILHTEVGFVGGASERPTYKEVSSGRTGHAEAVRVAFNPRHVAYEQLLTMFFDIHDATQLNRQGSDVGTQYRSAIFFNTPHERYAAASAIAAEAQRTGRHVATTVEPAGDFWPAEEYHQRYLAKGGQSDAKGVHEPIRCYG